ncbi:MAG TPA: hypothetical protein VGP31_04210 [Planosporangium sp.]|nr:hypothetical protein [Planosporangium sp.]
MSDRDAALITLMQEVTRAANETDNVDGHGRSITVHTAPGEGATFTVALPTGVKITPVLGTA